MDNFKFRAWHSEQNRMIDVYGLGPDFATENTIDGVDPGINAFMGGDFESLTIMQCIGKQDKNGRDIYEGDIIPFDFSIDTINAHYIIGPGIINGYVEWCNPRSRYIIKYPESKRYNVVSTEFGWAGQNHFEVIGNIYQNPELLKEVTNG